jgi:hypothetical protein
MSHHGGNLPSTLSYAAANLPLGLSINGTGRISGTVSYSADEATTTGGNYSSTVIVADGFGGSASANFTWIVPDTPRGPVVTNPGNQANAQGDTVSLQVASTDPDGNILTYSASNLPSGLTIDSTGGLISGTIGLSAAAGSPYTTTVTASDKNLSTSKSFTWTVSIANQTPQVTSPGDQANATGDTVSLPIAAADSDGDSLTYTASGLPSGLAIDPGTGIISGTVAMGADGSSPYTVTVRVSDGMASGSQTFHWTVSRVGVTNPGNQTNANGDVVSLQIQGTDSANLPLTYSATALPTGLTINSTSGLIAGTLSNTADAGSPYNTTISATDGTQSGSQSFTWTVTHIGLNNPGNQINREGNVVSLQVSAHDSDGDALTYSATGLPAGLSVNSASGLISGTVGATAHGQSPYTVRVTASDSGHSASQTFTWTVTPHVVVIPPGSQSGAVSDPISLPITASDLDGDTLTFSATGSTSAPM